MEVMGIDIGGSGIKGGIVDTEKGILLTERHKILTPQPAEPEAVADTVQQLIDHFGYAGPVGCGFPTLVIDGWAKTSGNLSEKWKGMQVDQLFSDRTGLPFTVVNDADAAGIAEMRVGAGKGKQGLVITITIGTGLGSGVFYNEVLIPNLEIGRMMFTDGNPVEFYAAGSVRKREDLDYETWGKRFNEFLQYLDLIFSPDLVILGGGTSRKMDRFEAFLDVSFPVIPAELRNNAGTIGAAMVAAER